MFAKNTPAAILHRPVLGVTLFLTEKGRSGVNDNNISKNSKNE